MLPFWNVSIWNEDYCRHPFDHCFRQRRLSKRTVQHPDVTMLSSSMIFVGNVDDVLAALPAFLFLFSFSFSVSDLMKSITNVKGRSLVL